ncbi:Fe-S cluster assembly scaffold protein SufB [Bradyrhizobium ottawaense]
MATPNSKTRPDLKDLPMKQAKAGAKRATGDVFAAAQLPGVAPVPEIRARAFEIYKRAGLPHRRRENWKYTDPRALIGEVLPLAPRPDADAIVRARVSAKQAAAHQAIKLVLVDGIFTPHLSRLGGLENEIVVRSLREVVEDAATADLAGLVLLTTSNPAISLNAAMATDGLVITVPDGAALNRPIHIVSRGNRMFGVHAYPLVSVAR